MRKRREFIKTMAGTAGALVMGSELVSLAAAQAPAPRVGRVMVGGRRVRVIDVHNHWNVRGLPALNPNAGGRGGRGGGRGGRGGAAADPVATRLALMDARGIDVAMLSVNRFTWYESDDRDLVSRYMAAQDEGLSAICRANPTRLVAVSSPSLQFPDLAAQQLERAMTELGLKGASVGGHCRGESLSDAKYDPFWAKCEELEALVFMHLGGADNLLQEDVWEGVSGDLGNIIGNPLESTAFVSRLIYDGTLDKFPRLKICVAHAGGYLASYLGRGDLACEVRGNANCANTRQFREYFKDQIMVDTMIFSDEGLRHLVAEIGAGADHVRHRHGVQLAGRHRRSSPRRLPEQRPERGHSRRDPWPGCSRSKRRRPWRQGPEDGGFHGRSVRDDRPRAYGDDADDECGAGAVRTAAVFLRVEPYSPRRCLACVPVRARPLSCRHRRRRTPGPLVGRVPAQRRHAGNRKARASPDRTRRGAAAGADRPARHAYGTRGRAASWRWRFTRSSTRTGCCI